LTTIPDHEAKFIVDHASRLITVSFRCVVSFGLADGLNSILLSDPDVHADWRQPVVGFHRDTLLMAALRTAILLDRDERVVSFQSIYHRLKTGAVETQLLQALEDRYGGNEVSPSRTELVAQFKKIYAEIDWGVHGRLTHFRNRGIAHLAIEELKKSVTIAELRTLVDIIGRLATTLRDLCQVPIPFQPDVLDEYRELAVTAIRRPQVGPV
jgi:hypothetical protein